VNTSDEDQAAFEELGRIIAKLFVGAIQHAADVSPEVAELLIQRLRDGRGARAVVGLDLGAAAVSFEFRGDDGIWREFIALKGEVPPALRPS
jgi:hypothetical protein